MKLKNQFQPIRQWAYDRGIYEGGNIKTQFIKVQEEIGETAKALLNNNREEIIDGIGDIVISLTNFTQLAEQHFTDECLSCRGVGGDFVANNHGSQDWVNCNPDNQEINFR